MHTIAKDLSSRNLTKDLAYLAAPLVASNLAYTLMGVVDTLFLGRVSAAALGAVGLANMLFLTLSLIFRSTISGVTTFVSRAYGAGELPLAGQHLIHFIGFALLLSPLGLLLNPLFGAFFRLMRPDPLVVEQAMLYLNIRIVGLPLTLVSTALISFLIGIGNTRLPAVLSWIAVGANIILNYVLIFGKLGFPALGVAGAAWATNIAFLLQMGLAAVIVYRGYALQYHLRGWSWPTWEKVRSMIKVGLPIGLADAVDVGAFAVFMGLISRLGTAELAVSQIVNQVSSVAFMPGFALGGATGSLVGRFLGAKEPELAEKIGYLGAKLGVTFMGLMGLVFWFLPRQLAGLFTPDPQLVEIAALPMRLIALYQIFDAMNIVFRGALNGAGDTRFAMVLTLCGAWGVFVPTVYFLAFTLDLGLPGAWGGALLYIFLLGVAVGLRFRSGRWKTISV